MGIGYSVHTHQHRWLPMTVGWMVSVGKGGARRAGDTDGNIYPAGSGVQKAAAPTYPRLRVTTANTPVSSSVGKVAPHCGAQLVRA